MFRRLLASLVGAALFVVACVSSQAQTAPNGGSVVSLPFTLSGTGPSYALSLSGQGTCSVVLTSAGVGMTLVPQVASDGPNSPATWVTASNVGGGSITTTGTYVGPIAAQGLTNFRINVTTLASGTVTGVESCSTASTASGASSGGGGGGSSATLYTPAPVGTAAPYPAAPSLSYEHGYNPATGFYDPLRVDPNHILMDTNGGTKKWTLPSGTGGGSCVNLATGAGRLSRMWTVGAATTAYVQLYDEASGGSCSAADAIWGDGTTIIVPAANNIMFFDAPIVNGLSYKITGTLAANLNITTFGLGF